MKKFATFGISLCIISLCSSCLKTRGQLREEETGTPETMPAQIRSVNPGEQPGATPGTASSSGGSLYAVDELRAEIARLTGRIEELERQSSNSEAVTALERRVGTLENRSSAATPAMTLEQTLSKAQADIQQGRAESAISMLTEAFRGASTAQVEELTFWRGEAYFVAKEHRKAILDFSTVTEKYPKSDRVAKSLLRIGQSFDALNMKEDAKAFYQELRERFPQSAAAKELKAPSTPTRRAKPKSVR